MISENKNQKLDSFKDLHIQIKESIEELRKLTMEIRRDINKIYNLENLITTAKHLEEKMTTIEKNFIQEFKIWDLSDLKSEKNE